MEGHLVIGLGGMGTEILTEVKRLNNDNRGDGAVWEYLAIDCGKNTLNSTVLCVDERVELSEEFTHQSRRIGRMMLENYMPAVELKLHEKYQTLINKSQYANITVHICTGLGGGLGSGTFIRLTEKIREMFGDRICRIYFHLIVTYLINPLHDVGYYAANEYAALNELNSCLKERGASPDALAFIYLNEQVEQAAPFIATLGCRFCNESLMLHLWRALDCCRIKRALGNEFDCSLAMVCTKSIVYPIEKLIDEATEKFVQQVINQILYNNWIKEQGYVKSLIPTMAKMIECQQMMEHYLLSCTERDYSESFIRNQWQMVYCYASDDKQNAIEVSHCNFHVLHDVYQAYYEHGFGHGKGVECYCNDVDVLDRVMLDTKSLKKRVDNVWESGVLGLCEISQLIETMIKRLHDQVKYYEQKELELSKEQKQRQYEVENMEGIILEGGLIKKFFFRDKNFARLNEAMLQLYICKTAVEACRFMKQYAAGMIRQMERWFHCNMDNIQQIQTICESGCDYRRREVSVRAIELDFYDPAYYFRDNQRMFTHSDKRQIDRVAHEVRSSFNNEKSFLDRKLIASSFRYWVLEKYGFANGGFWQMFQGKYGSQQRIDSMIYTEIKPKIDAVLHQNGSAYSVLSVYLPDSEENESRNNFVMRMTEAFMQSIDWERSRRVYQLDITALTCGFTINDLPYIGQLKGAYEVAKQRTPIL